MRIFPRIAVALVVAVSLMFGVAGGALAGDRTEDRLKALEDRIRAQDEEIRKLRGDLDETRPDGEDLESQLDEYFAREEGGGVWDEPGTLVPQYSKGVKLKSNDKATEIKFGGRIMVDFAWFMPNDKMKDELGDPDPGAEFRRARFFMSGTIYSNVFYKAQFDFGGGDATFKDMYIGVKKLPVVGSVKVGHMKVPFSLEELTSSKYITFMERALPVEAFSPSRATGIQVGDRLMDGNMHWNVMWFSENADDYGDAAGLESSFAARVAWAIVNEDEGRNLIHVGLSFLHRDPYSNTTRHRARPSAHLSPYRIADTGTFEVDSYDMIGLEFAWVMNSLSVQFEYMMSMNHDGDTDVGDPTLMGGYVYVSYWLTGEHRPYKKGAFSRVKPLNDFGEDGGGAWELGLRLAMVDLDDFDSGYAAPDTLKATNITVGANWHLNPNTRVMFNYVLSDTDDVGSVNVFEMRFQIDF
ncbi:MAG: porin [Planctomycetota bacterium]